MVYHRQISYVVHQVVPRVVLQVLQEVLPVLQIQEAERPQGNLLRAGILPGTLQAGQGHRHRQQDPPSQQVNLFQLAC